MSQFELNVALATLLIVYTSSVVGLVLWLSNKFRAMERTFYRELAKHNRQADDIFATYGLRIQRLELRTFGFTEVPSSQRPSNIVTPSSDRSQQP